VNFAARLLGGATISDDLADVRYRGFHLVHRAYEDVRGLSSSQKAILVYLSYRADDRTGIAWPSEETIAEETGFSISTVRRALRVLEAQGLVVGRWGEGYKSRTYHIAKPVTVTGLCGDGPVTVHPKPVTLTAQTGHSDRQSSKNKQEQSSSSTGSYLTDALIHVCTGRDVSAEAGDVITWATRYVDGRIIDEAIGWFWQQETRPTLPRAVASVIQKKAANYNIRMPTLEPKTAAKQ
jgi:hypothetical protein